MNPFGSEFWVTAGKLGPWTYVVCVLIVGLLLALFFVLREQREAARKLREATAEATAERKSITSKFIEFMETHIAAETKTIDNATSTMTFLRSNCENHQRLIEEYFRATARIYENMSSEHASIEKSLETNRNLIISAIGGNREVAG